MTTLRQRPQIGRKSISPSITPRRCRLTVRKLQLILSAFLLVFLDQTRRVWLGRGRVSNTPPATRSNAIGVPVHAKQQQQGLRPVDAQRHHPPPVEEPKPLTARSKVQPTPPSVASDIKETLGCGQLGIGGNKTRTALTLICTLENIQSREEKEVLLEIWRRAREQVPSTAELTKILSWAVPLPSTLIGKKVELWAPAGDKGLETVLHELNQGNGVAEYGVADWKDLLGPDKVFVDVGSNLGLVSLSVLLEYPGTKVVSIEAAAPTYIYQLLNLGRNLPPNVFHSVYVEPSGLGRTDGDSFRMIWRPYSTTSTRSWTPIREHRAQDIELQVPIVTLRTVLKAANVVTIDVCKMDCEGCEYNVIPSLTDAEFASIRNIVGEVHWGYIPDSKKPPSALGITTHARLCQHENFAVQAKECCSVPDTLSRQLRRGSLCKDFDSWAKKERIFDIRANETEWEQKDSAMAK